MAPIVVVCKPGYYFDSKEAPTAHIGAHGYHLPSDETNSIFIARGPVIKKDNVTLEPFSNLDLYPFIAKIMGIDGLPNNGTDYLVKTLLHT